MACPAPVSSTVSRRSGARAGAEASQHPPGDGRCCQRVRFGLYYRNLLASLLLPFYVPRQHWPCRRGEGRRTTDIRATVSTCAGLRWFYSCVIGNYIMSPYM